MLESAVRAKAIRMERLSRRGDGQYLFVPLDHSVSDGPIVGAGAFDSLVGAVIAGGADAVILHKGRTRFVRPSRFRQAALIVHLSAGTSLAPDTNAKVLVGAVDEAVTIGADAVSVHVNLGAATESTQLADLGAVASACERWGMPLLAMMYPRGPRVADPHDPVLLAHAVSVAVDLGADLAKVPMAATVPEMADVVAASPIPVLAAGGPVGTHLPDYVRGVLAAGCRGLAVGRRVFGHPDPAAALREIAPLVHPTEYRAILADVTPVLVDHS